jgi:hypothetical protein
MEMSYEDNPPAPTEADQGSVDDSCLPHLARGSSSFCPRGTRRRGPGGAVLRDGRGFYRCYIYFAFALQTIARKTNTANGWWAWIPILQIVLSLNVARKPVWWIFLCLIPLVNLVMCILIWMGIAEARNRPSWWGILLLVPVVNLIVPAFWPGQTRLQAIALTGRRTI